ncbi:hypothetical protein S7711_02698 [Stachybotrys chartarum IBT 7711]|uniref:Glycosyl transferase family 8 protein n=1 Tax=Stachybotrys chartarum (strain CBS 109288 / IBT 7711) TaxID=1280523 RepID=A0A084AZ11_STACB|nr:hypothetical protein S7711_02698 [Stachybotrys chartarum IBT 7711]KFA54423.1 hypothetical protein S40293_04323 [Stachybotrys chartarum IBT 40293]
MFLRGGRRLMALALGLFGFIVIVLINDSSRNAAKGYLGQYLDKEKKSPQPIYLPEPDWIPPPVEDPFPELSTSDPPPIPAWNVPKKDLHKEYGIDYAPPLFIGFTRTWPLLLQAVVSYITAGWPAEQIYVVENTGVQWANKRGKLTLQNPFYLNYAQLEKLGVKVIQTPVLMNFAQLQNFYVHQAHENDWPYYFWSHMDVLALSYEDGMESLTPKAGEQGYKTLYELCLAKLNTTVNSDERWADKFFAYDHLTLVNRQAYDEIGGWDTFIPYYMTDCDMHSRLLMDKWTQQDAKAGIITDVNTALKNLRALYRDKSIEPDFTDPNPPAPPPNSGEGNNKDKRDVEENHDVAHNEDELVYWRKLRDKADHMFHYKHGDRGRNTWQVGQRGGEKEPYYYPSRGIAESIDVLTEAGREVFRRKWGHRDCDLVTGAGLQVQDQWRVAPDWN